MRSLHVLIERSGKKVKVVWRNDISMKDVIIAAGCNPVEIVPVVNGEIVTDAYKIKEKDKIELLSVVSGG
ncbi:MAG TPA: MoaD/ThiS family protein [Candidatus Nanoarchaeia archaeon]|nr:MoaD/ThiS family protein [Candidatus Nanoarchaeia archaeon]